MQNPTIIINACGRGSRIADALHGAPKVLADINGKSALERIVESYAEMNAEVIYLLCQSRHANMLISHIELKGLDVNVYDVPDEIATQGSLYPLKHIVEHKYLETSEVFIQWCDLILNGIDTTLDENAALFDTHSPQRYSLSDAGLIEYNLSLDKPRSIQGAWYFPDMPSLEQPSKTMKPEEADLCDALIEQGIVFSTLPTISLGAEDFGANIYGLKALITKYKALEGETRTRGVKLDFNTKPGEVTKYTQNAEYEFAWLNKHKTLCIETYARHCSRDFAKTIGYVMPDMETKGYKLLSAAIETGYISVSDAFDLLISNLAKLPDIDRPDDWASIIAKEAYRWLPRWEAIKDYYPRQYASAIEYGYSLMSHADILFRDGARHNAWRETHNDPSADNAFYNPTNGDLRLFDPRPGILPSQAEAGKALFGFGRWHNICKDIPSSEAIMPNFYAKAATKSILLWCGIAILANPPIAVHSPIRFDLAYSAMLLDLSNILSILDA